MALNERSPNVSYTYDSPAVGPSGGSRRTASLNSATSTGKKSGRACRRSPRLLPPPPAAPSLGDQDIDDDNADVEVGKPLAESGVTSIDTDELMSLRNELAAAKEEASKYKAIVDSVRDVLATSSPSIAAVEDPYAELRKLVDIEEPKEEVSAPTDAAAASLEPVLEHAGAQSSVDTEEPKEEESAPTDAAAASLESIPEPAGAQVRNDANEPDIDEPFDDDKQEITDSERLTSNENFTSKLVLNVQDESTPEQAKEKNMDVPMSQRGGTIAIQNDSLLQFKPSPSLDQSMPRVLAIQGDYIPSPSCLNPSKSLSPEDDSLLDSKPDPGPADTTCSAAVEQCSEEMETSKDEIDESYDAGVVSSVVSIFVKKSTGEGEETKPDSIPVSEGNSVAQSGTKKTVLDGDDQDSKAKTKRDKKQRRRTIALQGDSLLKASPVMSPSPKPSESTDEWLPTSSSSSSSAAASRKLVAKDVHVPTNNCVDANEPKTSNDKDIAKSDPGKVAGGTSASTPPRKEKPRRSQRRRTMALQGDKLLLKRPGSNTPDVPSTSSSMVSSLSKESPAPLEEGGKPHKGEDEKTPIQPPILPSPVQTQSKPSATRLLKHGSENTAPKPPLGPSSKVGVRKSRRASVLPERLRQEDVLLDPSFTPNSLRGEARETTATNEQQGAAPSLPPLSLASPIEKAGHTKGIDTDEGGSVSSATQEQKKKRRRRSSIGFGIAGGAVKITAQEMEALAPKLKKRSVPASSSDTRNKRHRLTATDPQREVSSSDVKPHAVVTSASKILIENVTLNETEPTSRPSDQLAAMGSDEGSIAAKKESDLDNGCAAAADNLGAILEDESSGQEAMQEDNSEPMDEEASENGICVEGIQNTKDETKTSASEVNDIAKVKSEVVPGASPVSDEDNDPLGIRSYVTVTTSSSLDKGTAQVTDWGDIHISAEDIRTRINLLFPGTDALIEPCVSARLFACASLVMERSSKTEIGGGRRLRSQPASQCKRILPLLKAFVEAELVSSQGDRTSAASSKDQRKLRFCSFDYSSTLTPVDRKSGSNTHLEKSIISLSAVLKEIDALRDQMSGMSKLEEEAKEITDSITFIVSTLQHIEHDPNGELREECSRSMPFSWAAQRFKKAAHSYRQEFQEAQSIMAGVSSHDDMDLHLPGLRHRLGEFIGRATRFYLRRFFDPVPLSLTNPDHENYCHVDLTVVRSRIHELVEMTVPEGVSDRDTAAADGSISSVFSFALRAIHEFFELNSLKASNDALFSTFFASGASQRGLGPARAVSVTLSNHDLEEILADIRDAHVVLAGVRAGKFIRALMHWPGVRREVEEAGGWGKVEDYGRMFKESALESTCPDEAHFTLLDDVDALLRVLDNDAEKMGQLEKECEENLRRTWKRFRCGTKSKQILQQNPKISIIADYLRDGKQLVFPLLAEPSEEEEE